MTKTNCKKCQATVLQEGFCDNCFYPGIEDDYNEYQSLIEEGHARPTAAVMSGWLGAEEI